MIYVMSDIHGHYEKFKKMLELIKFSSKDHLYICGDVIDRGPEPIKLLLEIISKENITLLIGNHEDMMYSYLTKGSGLEDWLANGGSVTLTQFIQLNKFEKEKILKYIREAPLVIPQVKVFKKCFYLTHSCFLEEYIDMPYYYKNAGIFEVYRATWERVYNNKFKYIPQKWDFEIYNKYPNTTMICGHTKTSSCFYGIQTTNGHRRISKNYKGHVINVDCGCSVNDNLACLRLNDMKEFYVL